MQEQLTKIDVEARFSYRVRERTGDNGEATGK